MKATLNAHSLRAASTVAATLLAFAAQNALATTPVGQSPKVVTKVHQPVGPAHKTSSFAPHPSNRRVFGDPIQAPILGHAPQKTPPPK